MRPPRFVTVAVALLLALLAPHGVARANPDTDKAEARKEFDAGVEADKRHAWAEALDHYLRANDVLEHAFTIYNIATDYEHLLKFREAGVWYRRYLDKVTDPADQAKVRQQLADLEARPGPLTVRSTPIGARAFIDDAPVGVTPVTVTVRGGTHRVAVEHDGQRAERTTRLTYGEPQTVDVPLGAQPATLRVFGSPSGATIYVDGQPSGTLPSAEVPVSEGMHEVRVVAVGFQPYAQTANAPAGSITKVPVALAPGGDSTTAASSDGVLVGYYLGLGGGADVAGRGAGYRTDAGVSAGHYNVGLGFGKLGDDELFSLLFRYDLTTARIAPFIGGEVVLTPSKGGGVFGGLRVDLVRGPAIAISALASVGAYRYTPGGDDDTSDTGSGATSTNAVNAFPITVSLIAVFGARHGGATTAVVPGAAPGVSAPGSVLSAP